MKVIGKRKPFKTNNSSEVLYGLHISNGPYTMGEERCTVMNALGESCTAIHIIHNFYCAEYNLT